MEKRDIDIVGFKKPSWEDILNREYDDWTEEHVVIDTCKFSIDESIEFLKSLISKEINSSLFK